MKNNNSNTKMQSNYRSSRGRPRSDRQIFNGGGRIFGIDEGIRGGERRGGGAEGRAGGEHKGAIFGLLLFIVVVGVEGG